MHASKPRGAEKRFGDATGGICGEVRCASCNGLRTAQQDRFRARVRSLLTGVEVPDPRPPASPDPALRIEGKRPN